jgi:transposase
MDQAGSSRWWAWCVASDDAVAYRILRRRSHKAAREVLRDYDGIVVTDGFSAYDTLQRAGPAFTHVHCWAHVRRKFIDSEDSYPNHSSHAVDLIGKLFEVEREAPRLGTHAPYAERRERLDLLARLRTEKSRPVIDELRQWAYDTLPAVLPQSNLAKAINYMLGLWSGLIRFLDDPRVPLTNNLAERSLRGPVIGRKNHYGSRSQRGTEVAAIFYSLFESAKLAGVDPHGYVLTALRRAIRRPGAITLPADLQN